MDLPILRRAERCAAGYETSLKAWTCADAMTHTRALGRVVGFKEPLRLYAARRGAGEAIDGKPYHQNALDTGSPPDFNQLAPQVLSAIERWDTAGLISSIGTIRTKLLQPTQSPPSLAHHLRIGSFGPPLT